MCYHFSLTINIYSFPHPLSLCLSVCVSVSLSVCLSSSLSVSLCLHFSVSLHLSSSLFIYLSFPLSGPLPLPLSFNHSLLMSVCPYKIAGMPSSVSCSPTTISTTRNTVTCRLNPLRDFEFFLLLILNVITFLSFDISSTATITFKISKFKMIFILEW